MTQVLPQAFPSMPSPDWLHTGLTQLVVLVSRSVTSAEGPLTMSMPWVTVATQ